MTTTFETLGVKAAKAYMTRAGQPTPELQGKLPSTETVSNVRTPWQRGRRVAERGGLAQSASDSSLNARLAR